MIITRADLNAVNLRLEQPLHTSSAFGNLAVSYLPLISGADVTAKDRKGGTPAGRAEELGYTLLEFTFTWLGEAGRDGDACGALRSSLPFRMVKRWLTGFGLTGLPAEDARHLHMLTRLHKPCERGQHAAKLGCEIPLRGLFTEMGADMVM